MLITERESGDAQRLRVLARNENNVKQRDRFRAVILAIEGEETRTVQRMLDRSRNFVQRWAYAYRDGGIQAIRVKRQPGRAPTLPRHREAEFKARLDAPPTPDDGVCTLRGEDIRRILQREFGAKYSLNGVYALLERLGYSCLSPRPRHEKNDPEKMERFKAAAPFVRTVKEAIAPYGGRVRVFFMDEARFGQQGTLTRVWAATGSRPTAVKQTKYEWAYLYSEAEPATGESVALLAPYVNTDTFNVFLQMLSAELASNEHAVLIMDQAGWHVSNGVRMPDNITALLLPPYSPELNPMENLWHYMKSHQLSNRSYRDYEHLIDAGTEAYRSLTRERIRSVCRCPYLTHEDDL